MTDLASTPTPVSAKSNARVEDGALSGDLERRVGLSRAALLWEDLSAAFWPLAAYIGVLAAVSLLDVWSLMPSLVHAGLFWFVVAGAIYFLRYGFIRFTWPSRAGAIERLESRNRLRHRPIAALADIMAEKPGSDATAPTSRALWREHIRRARERIGRPKVGWPSPELALRDPRAIRAGVLILLVVGFAAAGSDWQRRLLSGFSPSFVLGASEPVSLDAWIAPPAYTGQPTIFLHSGEMQREPEVEDAKAIRVPAGSKIVARVGGGTDRPEILADGKTTDFRRVDKATEELTYVLDKSQSLKIRHDGRTVGNWAVDVIPDRPPAAAFMAPPQGTVGYALHIQFAAADDYGVESVKLTMVRPGNDKEVLAVALPAARGKPSVSGDHYQDLTNNPWAGQKVIGRIEARDALNQVGLSEPVEFTLPEREFTNPVAKKIVALRKHLKDHPEDRTTVMASLAQIMDKPQDFENDVTTSLALGDAYWRLEYDKSKQAIGDVADELWKTAIHIENDRATRARNDLRAMMEQLQKALAEGASQQQLDRLMNQLRAALERYLQAMQASGQKNGDQSQQSQQAQNGADQKSVTMDELRKMLDQAQSMSRTGARQAASQLLSQLQSILENLSNQANGSQGKGQQAMQQAIANLDKLARRQQSLMDQTFRQGGGQDSERNQPGSGREGSQEGKGQGQSPSTAGLAGKQGALRQELEGIMQSLGGRGVPMPQDLSRAGSAMGDAQSALGLADRYSALNSQGEALQDLRTGIGQLVDSINKMMGQAQNGQGSNQGVRGGFNTEHINLPADADVQKSREILDELRKRSGEWERPREELDYINRLLDVF